MSGRAKPSASADGTLLKGTRAVTGTVHADWLGRVALLHPRCRGQDPICSRSLRIASTLDRRTGCNVGGEPSRLIFVGVDPSRPHVQAPDLYRYRLICFGSSRDLCRERPEAFLLELQAFS